ncbi:hypothetical protein FALCPG4_002694 [Fusarium falciforme]
MVSFQSSFSSVSFCVIISYLSVQLSFIYLLFNISLSRPVDIINLSFTAVSKKKFPFFGVSASFVIRCDKLSSFDRFENKTVLHLIGPGEGGSKKEVEKAFGVTCESWIFIPSETKRNLTPRSNELHGRTFFSI